MILFYFYICHMSKTLMFYLLNDWGISEWGFLVTLVLIAISVGVGGKNIISSISEMKPEVKKIPVIEKTVNILESTLERIDKHIDKLESKLDATLISAISKSNSPRELNDVGKKLVQDSGIAKIVEENKEWIFEQVKKQSPQNSYRAEQFIIAAVEQLGTQPNLINKIEESAYQTGQLKEIILLAGALFIRDEILKRFNMNSKDIDAFIPPEKSA